MTINEYKNNGFNISAYYEQAAIDRAEVEVKQAYITPIVGAVEVDEAIINRAVMNCAFLLLLRRDTSLTRAGGKLKTTAQSSTPTTLETISEQGGACHLALVALADAAGVKLRDCKIFDICRIYFETNFINF